MELVRMQTQTRLVALGAAGCCAWLGMAAATSASEVVVTKTERVSKQVFEGRAQGGLVLGPGEFESGFEPPCFLGFIGGGGSGEPQNCDWHASAAAFAGMQQPEIEDDNPASGAQHLHFEYDPNQASGSPDPAADPDSRNWAFSDDIVPTPEPGLARLTLDLFISALGGENAYFIQPQAPTLEQLTVYMIFNADGSITIIDDGPGGICAGEPRACEDEFITLITLSLKTGEPLWTPGEYVPIEIIVDVPNDRVQYFYGDDFIWSTDPAENPDACGCGVPAGTIIEHVLIRYEGNINDGTFMDVDNVVISGEDAKVECPEDISGDGSVGFADLLAVLNAWGPCPGGCPEDISGDESVGFADLLAILNAWGPCP